MNQIIGILSLAGISVGLLLFFLLLLNKENRQPSRFLAFAVLSLTMLIILQYLLATKNLIFHYFTYLALPAIAFYGPLVYFYTKSLLFRGFVFRKNLFPHLVWPIIMLIFHATAMQLYPDLKNPIKALEHKNTIHRVYSAIVLTYLVSISITYVNICLWTINKYIYAASDQLSQDARNQVRWLQIFFLTIIIMILSKIISGIIVYIGGFQLLPFFLPGALFLTVKIYIIGYFLFKKSELVYLRIDILPSKYKKQKLDKATKNKYLKQLTKYIAQEKFYLNDNMTIQELSKFTGIPAHHISITINSELNQNFYQFVSDFRLKDAAQRLCDPQKKDKSVLEIAFESGFQSKSTFNRLFKRTYNITPIDFRNQNLKYQN